MSRFILGLVLAAVLSLTASGLWAQPSEFGPAQAYVVQKGDTASSLAKRFYGKSALGGKLWQANRGLVAHPDKLTAGDTIYLFPESALQAGRATAVPPPPLASSAPLYDRGRLFNGSFPKYFNFLADSRGLGESGSVRVAVKRVDPHSAETVDKLYEVRNVGLLLASADHDSLYYGDAKDKASHIGKTLLSTNDNVIIQFTEDLAKILDSDTYGQADPYFRDFPVYGLTGGSRATDPSRPDHGQNLGELFRYKGQLSVVARVEGLAPLSAKGVKEVKRKKGRAGASGQDMEPVSYVARITYTEDVMELNDRVFVFVPLDPGPERVLDAPLVEAPDTYVSAGH